MKITVFLLLLISIFIVVYGCDDSNYAEVITTIDTTDTPVTIMPETEEVTTSAVDTTDAETQETEATTEKTEPIETEPAVTEPIEIPPPEPHTNISHQEAEIIIEEIYGIVSEYENISMYFMDVEGEYWLGIGEDMFYHTASTIKPIYCQYLISSGVDMDMKITLQEVSRTSSSGKLTEEAVGSVFTVGELIEYSIRYSDNQAYRLLYETFGVDGYNKYVSALGSGGLSLDEEKEWTVVTPKKLSFAMLDIYRYGEADGTLIEHLKNTDYDGQITAGTRYETAHKYGNNGGAYGYHDTAVVYAPNCPYILTILTKIDTDGAEDENVVFHKITELCDKLHAVLFVELYS